LKGEPEVTHVKVHYNGWKPHWDEWIEFGERIISEDQKIPEVEPYDWGTDIGLVELLPIFELDM